MNSVGSGEADNNLSGQLALVTGASRGLGAALARDLASRGCDLVLVARRPARLMDIKTEICSAHDVNVHVIEQDLSVPGAARALYETMNRRELRPNVVINNAGRSVFGGFHDLSCDTQSQLVGLNLVAPLEIAHLFGRDMVARGSGRILMISSVAGFQGGPHFATYAATKAFVTTFGEALSFEFRHSGVTCTTLAAGMIRTEVLGVAAAQLTLYKRLFMMAPSKVAKNGIDAMLQGRHVTIPGIGNKLIYATGLVMPRKLRTRLAHSFMVTGKWFTTMWGLKQRSAKSRQAGPGDIGLAQLKPEPGE